MTAAGWFQILRFGFFTSAAFLLLSCDADRNHHLKKLAAVGIAPSGRALLDSVSNENHDQITWLLEAGVHTEQRDPAGRSPLRIALEKQSLRSVFSLIAAGADVNSSTPDGVSVLGVALAMGETAVASKLLEKGARANGLTPNGDRIMPTAIRHGHLAFIRALKTTSIDPHQTDIDGNPLLHIAIASGQRAIAESLIELGANPGMCNAKGETTLQLAFQQGWKDLIPSLAAAGADPNASPPDQPSLLEAAVASGDLEQIDFLLKIGANPNHSSKSGGKSPFVHALEKRDFALIERFLAVGGKPSDRNWHPWLQRAFDSRDLSLSRLLLANGARWNHEEGSLLKQAVIAREPSFVRLYLNYGFPAGDSLWLCTARGDMEIGSLLLEAGFDPDETRIPYLDTPLISAIRGQHDQMAALLLEHGANPGWSLPEGQSVFHLAVATGCHRVVKYLLDAGVDPNSYLNTPASVTFIRHVRPGVMRWILKNDRNVTPLMLAADSGNLTITRLLLDAGAKKSVWTRSSKLWPINFASRRNDVKMMRLILGQNPDREERHIVVKISEQKAWLYDSDGNELLSTRVSTGKKAKPTPTGEFVITNKHRTWTSTIYDSSMPFFQRLSCSDFGLHQGYVPGYPASSGCIRVPAGNAAKLFSLTQAGDRVRIIP